MAVPPKKINHPYPLIDNDPYFGRVLKYFRVSDYATIVGSTAFAPGAYWLMDYCSPAYMSREALRSGMRNCGVIGLTGGFLLAYQRSSYSETPDVAYANADFFPPAIPVVRFWGWTENEREVQMDMREMVDKVKRKEPLYGETSLTPYMQGVAARNSRYSQLMFYVFPWFNLANHDQHGVDTAKYYKAAEEEMERERLTKEGHSSG
ncbi:hypothetical protein Dda_1391 [Drechslerella dactyloides]|uniref:NADH-ubiquinone oxidoreductase 21 kDa subunit n=1 Tax=Drechslerella dactyloides TaxID=74499 RepID=A0AAD6J3C9_DREDA|nr:hypothetical protein Dda_1391 [Drechslerella dactyloides]